MIQYIWAYNDTDKYEIFEYQDLKKKVFTYKYYKQNLENNRLMWNDCQNSVVVRAIVTALSVVGSIPTSDNTLHDSYIAILSLVILCLCFML